MVILDADLDEETVRANVERWLQLIESKEHRTEGYYVVLQARAEPAAMDELGRVLSLADEVIRHKVLRIPEKVYGPPKVAGGTPAES
jgi:small subunit ribosomal protein S6